MFGFYNKAKFGRAKLYKEGAFYKSILLTKLHIY
jgi:hypothetical protein